jgi:hypothetical protein
MSALKCPAKPHPTYPLVELVRFGDFYPGCEEDGHNPDDWMITCNGVIIGFTYKSYSGALEDVDAVLFSEGDGSYALQVIAAACAMGAVNVAVSVAHGLGYEQGVYDAKRVFTSAVEHANDKVRQDFRSIPPTLTKSSGRGKTQKLFIAIEKANKAS